MCVKEPSKSEETKISKSQQMEKDDIQTSIDFWNSKIKKIYKRVQVNELRLESMESHSDYDYKDLLKESNEAEKDHKKDLKLLVDLLERYNIAIR
jgi:predicted  nucleic acid-binding Zn-ribbon protein